MNAASRWLAGSLLSLVILAGDSAQAQGWHTWDGGSGTEGKWSNATNWLGDAVPANPTANYLNFAGATRLSNTADVPWTLFGIIISNNAGGFIVNGSDLTITASGTAGTPAIFTHSGASNVVINNNIILPTTLSPTNRRTMNISGSGSATFNGSISNNGIGLGDLHVRGGGSGVGTLNGRVWLGTNTFFHTDMATWIIASTNNVWGKTQLDQTGTVRIAVNDAMPTNTFVQFDNASPRIDMNNFNQTILGMTGTGVVRTGTGAGGTLTISDLGANNTFRGQIVESGRLVKQGAGTFTMAGGTLANTFTGGVTVLEGVLLLQKNNGTNNINGGPVLVQTGAVLRLAADSQINDGISSMTLNQGTMDGQTYVEGVSTPVVLNDSVLAGSTANGFWLARGGYFGSGTNLISKRISTRAADPTSGVFNIQSGTTVVSAPIYTDGGGGTPGVTKTGAGRLEIGGANTYAGSTTVSDGTLAVTTVQAITNSPALIANSQGVLDLTSLGTYTMPATQTIRGSGVVSGNVTAVETSKVLPGTAGTPGTLTISGDLLLPAGYTNYFDLTNSVTVGGGVNDLLVVGSFYEPQGSTLAINALVPLLSGTYRLINYGDSSDTNFNPVILGATSRDTWTLDTATHGQVNLIVTAGTNQSLAWNPVTSDVWDIGLTTNWQNTGTAQPDAYYDSDSVRFDDSGAATNVVVLNTTVRPQKITVSSSSNYTIAGSGSIADGFGYTAPLTKDGSGALTLGTVNSFSGGVVVSNGAIVVATNNSLGTGLVTFRGGSLGQSGGGASIGNIVQADVPLAVDVGGSVLTLNGYLTGVGAQLTKTGSGTLTLAGDPPGNFWTGNVVVAQGTLAITSGNNAFPFGTYSNVSRTMTIDAGATVSNVNAAHNLLGTETAGLMKLIVSNGTYLVPAYNHIRELDMYGGWMPANGAMNDGLDIRTGNVVNAFSSPSAATIDAKITIRGTTPVNVEDGPLDVDLILGGQIAGNNGAFYFMKTNFGTMMMTGTVDNSGLNFLHDGGTTILAKASSASIHATGATNVTIRSGTVQLAGTGDDQIFVGNDVDLHTPALFDMNGRNEGFDELRGTGTVVNTAAATTSLLTLGQTNGTSVFAGSINEGPGIIGLRKHGTGTITLSGASTYSGGTTVSVGALIIDGSVIGRAVTVLSNATLGGNGTIGGDVIVAGAGKIVPNRTGTPGTMTISSNLMLDVNTQPVNIDLTNSLTVGGGVNDLIAVGGNLDPNGASIQINPIVPLGGGQYTLFTFGGAKPTSFNAVPGGTNTTRLVWSLVETNANQVNLLVSGSFGQLKWNSQTSTNWDNAIGTNWLDTAGGTNTQFFTGDSVLFDDSGAVTNTIGLVGTLQSADITVRSSSNYSITGAGKISGTNGLVKDGTGTLTLGGTGNDYNGAVVVSGGVVKAAQAGFLGGNGKTITVSSGAQINFNGVSQTGSNYYYIVSGSGPDGRGVLVNTNGSIGANSSVKWIELTADTTVGSLATANQANENGRFDIGLTGGINGNGYTLTKVGFGPMSLRGIATNLQLVINEGMVYGENVNDPFGSNVIVNAGAIIGGYSNARTFSVPVTMNGGMFATRPGGGAPTWAGTITLVSNTVFSTTAGAYNYGNEDIVVRGAITGPGSLTKRGNSTLRLFNTNDYAGGTIMENVTNSTIVLASTNGPAIMGAIQIGHRADGGGNTFLYPTNHNQFAPGVAMTVKGSPNDWAWIKLFGTTQYVASIVTDDNGGGVLDHVYQEAGYNSDSELVFTGPGDSYWSASFIRDSSTNASVGRIKLTQSGPGTVTLAGGRANTTFNGGVTVNSGVLNVKSAYSAGKGVITINSGSLALDAAGLKESSDGNLAGINTTLTNTISSAVKLSPVRADMATDFGTSNQWNYTGFIINTSSSPVTWTFGENIDDRAYIKIDNTVVLNDAASATPTLGTITLAPGLHDFDLRVQNGTGAAGPRTGGWWTNASFGIGVDFQGMGTPDQGLFQRLEDNGSGSLLVTDVQVPNTITLNADATVRVSSIWGPTNTIQGNIGGAGGFTKTGAGTLRLTGTNSYAGATVVAAGKLFLDSTNTGAGAVTVLTNTVLWGIGSAGSSAATVQNGGQLGPESTIIAGTLTVAGLTLDAGSKVTALLNGTNPTHRSLGSVGSSPTVDLFLLPLGPLAVGTNVLVDYGTSFTGAIGDFSVFVPNGGQGDFVNNLTDTTLELVVTNAGLGVKWDGAADAQWRHAGQQNWKSILAGTPTIYQVFDNVLFDDTATGTTTVNLTDVVSPSSIVVSNETKDYVWSGGGISGNIGLTKQGAAKLTISGSALSYTGDTVVSAGSLKLDSLVSFNSSIANATTVELASASGLWQAGGSRAFSGGVFRKTGAGSVSIWNGTFNGSSLWSIDEGTLRNDGNLSIWSGNTSDLYVASGAIFNMMADPVRFNRLTGAGTITNGWGNNGIELFTIGVSDGSAMFSGVIQDSGRIGNNAENGSIGLLKTGSGTQTLAGVNNYMGGTILDGGTLAYTADQPFMRGIVFGSVNSSTNLSVLDLSNASMTAAGLTNRVNNADTNIILIGAGRSLVVTGRVVLGSPAAPTLAIANQRISGEGSFIVNDTNGLIQIANAPGGNNNTNQATLDLSGLDTFTASLGAGNINVGSGDNNGGNAPCFILLAATNSVTVTSFNIGPSSGGSLQSLVLGSVSNSLNVDTLNAGTGPRDRANVTFGPGAGTLVLRNRAGTGRAALNLSLLTLNTGTTYSGPGLIDLTDHSADLLISTLNIGVGARNGWTTNTFMFDTGILDATGIRMAHLKGTANNVAHLIIGGGTVNIGANGLIIASNAVGNVVLNGGTVTSAGSITKGNAGTGTATLTLDGASLDMQGNVIGGATPINSLNLLSGSLANVAEINNGAAWTKESTGTLAIAGANALTGPGYVSNGALLVNGSISGTGGIIVNGGTLGGTGLISGSVTVNSGSVAPGTSIGLLTVLGDFTQTGGSLDIQIAGTNDVTGYDVLTIGGQAILTDTLNVTTNGYAPAAGDTFTILSASAGVFGTFGTANLPPLTSPELGWKVEYLPVGTPTMVILSVTSAPTGPVGYDLWAGAITNGLTNYNESATGDGYPNLLKYATGSNPTNADNLAQMNRTTTNGMFALKFNRNTNATDLTLIIEGSFASTNEATWNGIATNIHGSWGATTNYSENTSTDPASVVVWDTATATNRFLRLRVTRP